MAFVHVSRVSSTFFRQRAFHWPTKLTRGLFYTSRVFTTEVAPPKCDGSSKVYPEKIQRIVHDISQLTLLEASQLNELLKSSLNLTDVPVMAVGSASAVPGHGSSTTEVREEEASLFSVKLVKYAEDSKIKLIKEVKSLVEGLNLVQAKKFVEGVPQVIQRDISKEAASKLKSTLEAVGGVVELE